METTTNLDEKVEETVIHVTEIDLENKTVSGKDKSQELWIFRFLPQTEIRQLSPSETTKPLKEFTGEGSGFPITKDEEILVSWRSDLDTGAHIAVRFTIFR